METDEGGWRGAGAKRPRNVLPRHTHLSEKWTTAEATAAGCWSRRIRRPVSSWLRFWCAGRGWAARLRPAVDERGGQRNEAASASRAGLGLSSRGYQALGREGRASPRQDETTRCVCNGQLAARCGWARLTRNLFRLASVWLIVSRSCSCHADMADCKAAARRPEGQAQVEEEVPNLSAVCHR